MKKLVALLLTLALMLGVVAGTFAEIREEREDFEDGYYAIIKRDTSNRSFSQTYYTPEGKVLSSHVNTYDSEGNSSFEDRDGDGNLLMYGNRVRVDDHTTNGYTYDGDGSLMYVSYQQYDNYIQYKCSKPETGSLLSVESLIVNISGLVIHL